MQSIIAKSVAAVAGVLLWVASTPAQAVIVTVDSVTGTWSDVQGSPSNLSGEGTHQIFFGVNIGSGQSSYLFNGVAPPPQGPFGIGTSFTLGSFTHINNPVGPNSITGATLNLSIVFETDLTGPQTLTSAFTFLHNETPNTGPGCCDDIVTVSTNVGGSQTFNINGIDYIFAFTGFQIGGQNVSSFSSPEGGSNSATITGTFTDVTTVGAPGPIIGAGLPGFLVAGAAFFGLRRRKKVARAAV